MNRKITRLAAPSAAIFGAFAGMQAWGLEVEVLSSMPELVSGGDALVRVSDVSGAPSVSVGGNDVSGAFVADAAGGWVGLIDGLEVGDNELSVSAGGDTATLTLTNHGINDTLFAGPQQTPFLCENEARDWWGPAEDASCAAPTHVKYMYQNTDGDWLDFDPNGARPDDLGDTATTAGDRVPTIIRQEIGIINRALYAIVMLHDPADAELPTPANQTANPGWNGKLMFCYGGGVQANYHNDADGQGGLNGSMTGCSVLGDYPLLRGFALASSSLSRFGANNNHVTSGESMAKVKEHFTEEFGPPIYTIGYGASGGSMQQNLIGNSYPGLMDAVIPQRLYVDTITFLQPLYDCELLVNMFETSERSWSHLQMTAVAGTRTVDYCTRNGARYPNARPSNCDGSVEDQKLFNPDVWGGVRCTYQDNLVNIFGTDPDTGFARNPFDNVGVQYGLVAFNDGVINFDEFVEINSRIGGHDIDGGIQPERQVGDPIALRHAYETGAINQYNGGLNEVPYFDMRGYTDLPRPDQLPKNNIDVHDSFQSEIAHARALRANGDVDNIVRVIARANDGSRDAAEQEGLEYLDLWMNAILNDRSGLPKAEVVRRNRPAAFQDGCYVDETTRITDWETCIQMFPPAQHPRQAAGGPVTEDIMKCQLKAIEQSDYTQNLSSAQIDTLRSVFPGGVCDYTKPGVGQVELAGTWIVYQGDGAFQALSN